MEFYFILFLSINLINVSEEIVPNWELSSNSINLLPSGGEITYNVIYRNMEGLEVYLYKTIAKNADNQITKTNKIQVKNSGNWEKTVDNVAFDNIESVYYLDNYNIICPKGKFHPYNVYTEEYIEAIDMSGKGDWDLKCYRHNAGFFLVFYLMNDNVFCAAYDYSAYDTLSWRQRNGGENPIFNQLLDFRLINDNGDRNVNNQWVNHKMASLVIKNNEIKLQSMNAQFQYTNNYYMLEESNSKT